MAQKRNGSHQANGLRDKNSQTLSKITMGEIMETLNNKSNEFYRFQISLAANNPNQKPKSVGMAYLRNGEGTYTVRLWMFTDRFYMVQTKADPLRYLLMSREPSRNPNAKNKFRWRIVGNGRLDTKKSVIELYFDLLNKPVLMSLYPESYVDKTLSDESIEAGNLDEAVNKFLAA